MSEQTRIDPLLVMPDEQKERFELRARDLMRWLAEHGNPYMSIKIEQNIAELLENDEPVITIQTDEYIVD